MSGAWISRLKSFSALLLLLILTGCATTQNGAPLAQDEEEVANPDPFESFNRSVHDFNMAFDDAIGKPVAKAYVRHIPGPARRSVSNFYNNLWEPSTVINSALQGKFHKAASATARFLINSTVGILGLFDVASKLDIPQQEEDLGQTLAVWGVPDGPYLVLPFLGPANVRDTAGIVTEWFTTDMVPYLFEGTEWVVVGGIRLVDSRASVLGLEETLQLQVDPYLFLRESYRQSRLIQIHDGAPIGVIEEDPFEDELFAE